jgi:hypothetical protein
MDELPSIERFSPNGMIHQFSFPWQFTKLPTREWCEALNACRELSLVEGVTNRIVTRAIGTIFNLSGPAIN